MLHIGSNINQQISITDVQQTMSVYGSSTNITYAFHRLHLLLKICIKNIQCYRGYLRARKPI